MEGVPGARWGYPTDGVRSGGKGADYQEEISGVPAGMEVNVGGTVQVDPETGRERIHGGVWVDHARVSSDGTIELVDAKDWTGWPPVDLPDMGGDRVARQARAQLDAAQEIGARVVWEFSDAGRAEMVREQLQRRGVQGVEIRVVEKK